MPNCPSCNGKGEHACFVDGYDEATGKHWGALRYMPCETCEGVGQVTGERLADIERRRAIGAGRRAARHDRRESMLGAAERMGVSLTEYSRWERGEEAPDANQH